MHRHATHTTRYIPVATSHITLPTPHATRRYLSHHATHAHPLPVATSHITLPPPPSPSLPSLHCSPGYPHYTCTVGNLLSLQLHFSYHSDRELSLCSSHTIRGHFGDLGLHMTPRDPYTVGKPTVGSIQWHVCTRQARRIFQKRPLYARHFFAAGCSQHETLQRAAKCRQVHGKKRRHAAQAA